MRQLLEYELPSEADSRSDGDERKRVRTPGLPSDPSIDASSSLPKIRGSMGFSAGCSCELLNTEIWLADSLETKLVLANAFGCDQKSDQIHQNPMVDIG